MDQKKEKGQVHVKDRGRVMRCDQFFGTNPQTNFQQSWKDLNLGEEAALGPVDETPNELLIAITDECQICQVQAEEG